MDAKHGVSSTIITLAGMVIVVLGLKLAAPLLAPLLLAALITATCSPIAAWLSARGLPAGVGAAVALLVGVAFLGGCGALIAYSASEARSELPTYWARAQEQAGALAAQLGKLGVHASRESVLSTFDSGRILNFLGSTLTAAADVLPHVVLMPLLVFFALVEVAGFGTKLRFILPDTSRGLERTDTAVREVQKYLLVKTATSLLGALLVGLLLFAFKIDFALLLAVVFFLLHFVPNVGSAIATVPGVAVALLQHGPGSALAVAVGYVLISGLVGNVIEPKVMGRTLGLSPLVVLLAMVLWGWLWGPIGALVSVPLTMIAKIVFENSDDLRWIAVLIGPTEDLIAPPARVTLIPAVLIPLLPQVRPAAPIGLGAGPNAIRRAATLGPRPTDARNGEPRDARS